MDIHVDTAPLKFAPPSQQRKVLTESLRIFAGVYRQRVMKRFAAGGPGWPPRADSTKAKHASGGVGIKSSSLADHRMRRQLEKADRKARLRYAKETLTKGAASEKARKSVDRAYSTLKEFERQMAGGSTGRQGNKADARLEAKLGKKIGQARAQAKQNSDRLLGRIPASMEVKVSGNEMVMRSRIPWDGVHNEGGTAGHGAKEPARPHLFAEMADAEMLAEIILNRALAALAG